ncbi:hypothetical protein NHX12_022214 [Muraenolepis orangiensis]|uniref:Uncharacterized protein n=1 Tax=Muraenolepis orangiensis TaxID=630683 RepID=A0A9Q0ITU5_9TELE|nr:hypothetical protein NHX12_022214 [Muraenolepis orangiensis]
MMSARVRGGEAAGLPGVREPQEAEEEGTIICTRPAGEGDASRRCVQQHGFQSQPTRHAPSRPITFRDTSNARPGPITSRDTSHALDQSRLSDGDKPLPTCQTDLPDLST